MDYLTPQKIQNIKNHAGMNEYVRLKDISINNKKTINSNQIFKIKYTDEKNTKNQFLILIILIYYYEINSVFNPNPYSLKISNQYIQFDLMKMPDILKTMISVYIDNYY